MNQSQFEVDFPASKEVAIKADPIYVGDDLHIDLWVRPKMGHPKSILIRSINEVGEIRTAFLHVDDEIRVIPTFGNDVELNSPKEKVENTFKPKGKTKKEVQLKVVPDTTAQKPPKKSRNVKTK